MSKWAPIIYSRTYETDFRLIAVPKDFKAEDQKWALNYILGTAKLPENWSNHPIWSFFENYNHRVVGVTCMAKELIANAPEEYQFSESMTKDSVGRPLYLFVGYVAQYSLSQHPFPKIPSKELKNFSHLYQYVIDRWNEQSYRISSNKAEYQYPLKEEDWEWAKLDQDCNWNEFKSKTSFVSDIDRSPKIFVWPTADNQNLWFAASKYPKPLSLCLDLFSHKEIKQTNFSNGTSFDVDHKLELDRTKDKQKDKRDNSSILQTDNNQSEQPSENFNSPPLSSSGGGNPFLVPIQEFSKFVGSQGKLPVPYLIEFVIKIIMDNLEKLDIQTRKMIIEQLRFLADSIEHDLYEQNVTPTNHKPVGEDENSRVGELAKPDYSSMFKPSSQNQSSQKNETPPSNWF